MKKIILSLSVLLLTNEVRSQLIDFRFFGGLGMASVSAPNSTSTINGLKYNNVTAVDPVIQFGISSTLGRRVFFQPGIMWQSGVVTNVRTPSSGSLSTTYEDQTKLSMIIVPLKIGIRLLKFDKLTRTNVRLFGGIDVQVVTGVDQITKSGLIDIKAEDFTKLTTCGDLGIGVDFLFLFADLGYRLAFNPVYNTGDQSRANMFYAQAGFRIKL